MGDKTPKGYKEGGAAQTLAMDPLLEAAAQLLQAGEATGTFQFPQLAGIVLSLWYLDFLR